MRNALEEVVDEVYDQLLRTHAEFCACSKCRDDALAHALNQARPKYLGGSVIGAAVTRAAITQGPAKAELSVLVFEAMRRVQANRRHGPEEFVSLDGGGAP
jgi:hypothetical protein